MNKSVPSSTTGDASWALAQRACGVVSLCTVGWALLLTVAGDVISPPTWSRGAVLTVLIAGAVGYGTNYLAVKMLFRPLKPVALAPIRWIWRQGLIPARQDELAERVGEQVATRLLRSEDLAEQVSRALTSALATPDREIRALFTPLLDEAVPVLRTHLNVGEAMDREALARTLRQGLQDNAGKVMDLLARIVRRQARGSGIRTWASRSLIDWDDLEDDFILQLDKPKGVKWSRSLVDALAARDTDWSATLMGDPSGMSAVAHDALVECVARWIDQGHLKPLLGDLNVRGQVAAAARELDVAELEQMANEVAAQHFGAIQVLGFVFGLAAGGLLVAAG